MLLLVLRGRRRRRRGRRAVVRDPGRRGAVLGLQRRVGRRRAPGPKALAAGGVVGDGEERHAGDEEREGPATEEGVAAAAAARAARRGGDGHLWVGRVFESQSGIRHRSRVSLTACTLLAMLAARTSSSTPNVGCHFPSPDTTG